VKRRHAGIDLGATVATVLFVAGFGGMIYALGAKIGLF
jgi:hypothetical protein